VRVAVPELPKSSPAPRPHLAIGHCERVRAACGNVLDMHLGKGSERPRDGVAGLVAVPKHTLPPAAHRVHGARVAQEEGVQPASRDLKACRSGRQGDLTGNVDGRAPLAPDAEVCDEGIALFAHGGASVCAHHTILADLQRVMLRGRMDSSMDGGIGLGW